MLPIAPGGLMREVITPTFDVRRDWQEEPGESSLSAQVRAQGERYLKVRPSTILPHIVPL